MSEAAVGVAERPMTQEKSHTVNDVARFIVKKDPDIYGPQGKFPIFKEGKFDSSTKEDINEPNFIRWMRQEIAQGYETQDGRKGTDKQPNKLSQLFRRIIPPRHKQVAPIDLAMWEANLEDFEKFISYPNDGEPSFHREEYMQFVQKKMTKANFDLDGSSD